jgi:hypothetical protein
VGGGETRPQRLKPPPFYAFSQGWKPCASTVLHLSVLRRTESVFRLGLVERRYRY